MSDRRGWGALLIMLVPVTLFAFLALRARSKPNVVVPDVGPFRIFIVGMERMRLTPFEAFSYGTSDGNGSGNDTKLRLKLKLQGRPFSGHTDYQYVAFCSIVSDASAKQGKIEVVPSYAIGDLRSDRYPSDQSLTFVFNLRDIPLSRGALRARFSFHTAPGKMSITASNKPDVYARQLTSDLYGFAVKKEIVIRAKGQKTPAPIVSTDPGFDIQKIEILPYKQKGSNDNARVVLHFVYRAPLDSHSTSVLYKTYFGLGVYNSDGKTSDYGDKFGGGSPAISQNGGRNFTWEETVNTRRSDKKAKGALIAKGWLSINNRWPRLFRVQISDKISSTAKSRP